MSVQLPKFTSAEQLLELKALSVEQLAKGAEYGEWVVLWQMIEATEVCRDWRLRCYRGYELAQRGRARYGPMHYKLMVDTLSPLHRHKLLVNDTPGWSN